jgi:hypothetical protein
VVNSNFDTILNTFEISPSPTGKFDQIPMDEDEEEGETGNNLDESLIMYEQRP